MAIPTLSYAELEALHNVLEAARCYWHGKPASHARAADTLRLANQIYLRLGEELPKSGSPSERFQPVEHSSDGGPVDQLLDFVNQLTGQYAIANDPWFPDTIVGSSQFTSALSPEELEQFTGSLRRLGLTLELKDGIPTYQMVAERRDWGPWPEDREAGHASKFDKRSKRKRPVGTCSYPKQ